MSGLQIPAPAALAPAGSRLVAFGVDAALALGVAFLVRLALARADAALTIAADPRALLAEPGTWLLALGLAALRDLPFGASCGKWLLCMRVTNPSGGRLPLGWRAVRAPFSLLPLEWLAGERRASVPWRVTTYSPAPAALGVRVALAALAAACSLLWGAANLLPSIGRADAARLVESTLGRDPALRRRLGEPLQFDIERVAPRAQIGLGKGRGAFALRVSGPRGRQEMRVHALQVEGRWVIDEVVDIRETRLASGSRPDTSVAR